MGLIKSSQETDYIIFNHVCIGECDWTRFGSFWGLSLKYKEED